MIEIEKFFCFGGGFLTAIGLVLLFKGGVDKKKKIIILPGVGIMAIGIVLLVIFH